MLMQIRKRPKTRQKRRQRKMQKFCMRYPCTRIPSLPKRTFLKARITRTGSQTGLKRNQKIHTNSHTESGIHAASLVSTLNSKNAPEDYRTYTYYFTVPENNGIALYVLEGTCYDPESRKKFTTIIKNAINSIEVNVEET